MSDELRGLSLLQPWAGLIAAGAKTIETRSWDTTYRGQVAIHASKRFTREQRTLCLESPFREALRLRFPSLYHDTYGLPVGCIVAVARVQWTERTDLFDTLTYDLIQRAEKERAFGDYSPGRYAWLLTDIRPLPTPVPCKGALGLWAVPAAVREQIEAALDPELRP